MDGDKKPDDAVTSAINAIKNVDPLLDRWKVNGALLGTSVAFFFAMLGVSRQQIDPFLSTAIFAFAIASCILASAFTLAGYRVKSDAPDRHILAIASGAWALVEVIGQAAAIIGMACVIGHPSFIALKSALITTIIIIVFVVPLIMFLIILSFHREDMKKKKQIAEGRSRR